jgi:hypothetical protein
MMLLLELSKYRLRSDQTLHWESAEEFDEAETLSFSLMDGEGLQHHMHLSISGRFHLLRKPNLLIGNQSGTELNPINGVYLGDLPPSKPAPNPRDAWQNWLSENWELNYWKAFHLIIEFEEIRVDAFSSHLWFNGKPVDLPKHPYR